VNRVPDHLQVATTNNYNAIADFHTTNHSMLSLLSLSPVVSWQRIYNSLTVTTVYIKSSLHRMTFKSQLNSLPTLPNHLRLPSQETPSIIPSAGLGSSLYTIRADPTENTVSIVIAQQCLDCCLFIRCCGNLFTESLPSNDRLLWLSYSGFQASYHIIFY
jgi:hypothetical protein